MIKFEEAQRLILKKIKRLGKETVRIEEAMDRVLAEEIASDMDVPPFNKSAMDGYAFSHRQIKNVPAVLKVKSEIRAGEYEPDKLKKTECLKIMTGAPLPKRTDCVVKMEDIETLKNNYIKIMKKPSFGENVCFKGEDVQKGRIILRKGAVLRGPEVAVCAAVGKSKVQAYRRPKVPVLSTGDELVEPDKKVTFGKIRNSNGPMLIALLKKMGISPDYLGIVKDKEKNLICKIRKGLSSDIFIISGGVSVGDYDLVPAALEKCGVKKIFHKLAITPGKPLFFGQKGGHLIFGVPGNPVSTYLLFLTLIRLAINRMMGTTLNLNLRKGTVTSDYSQRPGRKRFVPAKIKMQGNRHTIYPLREYHGSADIISLVKADGFMIIPDSITFLEKNSSAEVFLW